jgi:hypothetical protein
VWIGSNADLLRHLHLAHRQQRDLGTTRESLVRAMEVAPSITNNKRHVRTVGVAMVDTSLKQLHHDTDGCILVCKRELAPFVLIDGS